MHLHSVEAQLDPRNRRSARVLEHVGFVKEGHLRENFVIEGRYCDTAIYSLLAPA
jgi:ribosomal-protein-alanine N-acetyltransferase